NPGTLIGFVQVVQGDLSANDDPSVFIDPTNHMIGNFAAHVVKIDIDAIMAGLFESLFHVVGLIVDHGIKPEFFFEETDFFRGSGDADHTAPFQYGDLSHAPTNGTGRSRRDHRLPLLRLTYLQQTEISRQATHPQAPESRSRGRQPGIHLTKLLPLEDGIILPSHHPGYEI